MDARVFNLLASYSRGLERDYQSGDALGSLASCSHGGSTVVCENAVRDPFLRSIDNIDISVSLRRGSDSSDVRSSCSFN